MGTKPGPDALRISLDFVGQCLDWIVAVRRHPVACAHDNERSDHGYCGRTIRQIIGFDKCPLVFAIVSTQKELPGNGLRGLIEFFVRYSKKFDCIDLMVRNVFNIKRLLKIFFGMVMVIDVSAYVVEARPPELIEEVRLLSLSARGDQVIGFFEAVLFDKIEEPRIYISGTSPGKRVCVDLGNVGGYYSAKYEFLSGGGQGEAVVNLFVANIDNIVGRLSGELYLKVRQIDLVQDCDTDQGVLLLARWSKAQQKAAYIAFNAGEDVSVTLDLRDVKFDRCRRTSDIHPKLNGKKFNFLCSIEKKNACGKSGAALVSKSGPFVSGVANVEIQIDCR